MVLMLGALLIISNNNLALKNQENLKKFGDIWISWTEKLFGNIQTMTGNAIKLDWNPE
ncbi:hypothetical protein HY212_04445 [Candidatus Pacearchaeota archaeon]|nr:hypothetical protein [Candidatus Pacearchaeota archaeon]